MRRLTETMQGDLRAVVRGETVPRHRADSLMRRGLVRGNRGKYKVTYQGMQAYNRMDLDDKEESPTSRFA